jgi:hypothetical protein
MFYGSQEINGGKRVIQRYKEENFIKSAGDSWDSR